LDHRRWLELACRRLIQGRAPVVPLRMHVETAALCAEFRWTYPGAAPRGAAMLRDGQAAAGNSPADWIRAIAEKQDRAAFAALFEFYAPRIKAMLTRLGTAADAAEDLAQETLLTVWRKAAYFDPERASAAAWIFTIARNLRIDRLRGDNRAKLYAPYDMVEPEGPDNPDSALNAAERDARVRAALKELSQEQVRVLQLSFFEGRAHGDIAALLDLPLGTVKSRVRLAMARLRNLLGDLQ
jgi:RNA polymerase sigma-70 factor (ECF subfamily)